MYGVGLASVFPQLVSESEESLIPTTPTQLRGQGYNTSKSSMSDPTSRVFVTLNLPAPRLAVVRTKDGTTMGAGQIKVVLQHAQ